ncbi:MAG TPA: metalloregulator ArsR/SmtB family transcription factor [Solirubrobacteraceae bacterium]|jgi:DNA-binding transcriptional ArsR family regulator|nr:metalloregulator ArsR/SmtB family transcription factor [Solirubrobacteraceae bacterium]
MRIIPHPDLEQLHLTDVLHALSDPVRLEIVRLLGAHDELSCGRLEVSVSKSTLTHHLRVLRDAGLTYTRSEGVQRLVSLRREDVDSRFPGLLDCVLASLDPRLAYTASV